MNLEIEKTMRESNAEMTCVYANLHTALRSQELASVGEIPSFDSVFAGIERRLSPLDQKRWPMAKGLAVTISLVKAQWGAAMHTVALVAAGVVAISIAFACALATSFSQIDLSIEQWLPVLIVMGGALCIATALSPRESDAVALSTPVGPFAVVAARLTLALAADLCASVLATSLAVLAGGTGQVEALVLSWLAPLILATGFSAFATVWLGSSWAGFVGGLAGLSLLLACGGSAANAGIALLSSLFAALMSTQGLFATGVVLLILSIALSGYTLRSCFDGGRSRA